MPHPNQESIGVIIPVLNEIKRVPELLTRADRLGSEQVIIVDGGSTDGTVEALTRECRENVKLLLSAPGRGRQMNAGAAGTDCRLLLFLHADTEIPDHATASIGAILPPGTSGWGRFDVKFDTADWRLGVVARCMNWRSALSGICTGDQAVFMSRDMYDVVGGFPEIPLMEDIEISRRLARRVRPIRIKTPVRTAARRWLQHGVARTVLLMWWFRFRYWLGSSAESLAQRYPHTRE